MTWNSSFTSCFTVSGAFCVLEVSAISIPRRLTSTSCNHSSGFLKSGLNSLQCGTSHIIPSWYFLMMQRSLAADSDNNLASAASSSTIEFSSATMAFIYRQQDEGMEAAWQQQKQRHQVQYSPRHQAGA
ncbi:hypothetical protein AKJ16_DCAP10294 [Drosera capensis]